MPNQLCLHINHQLAILNRARTALPSHLADHALHAVLKNNKLIIYTDSALWASQLRFFCPVIKESIEKAYFLSLNTTQIKIVRLPTLEGIKPNRSVAIPSQSVINEIRDQSRLCTDAHLKKSFLKLSNTLDRLRIKNNKTA
ncbi:MAG: DUF721 domain-containing protein [Methylococcaceae bacterium]|nr:DUF721 domain-containing protein [Methylococcaceae bacterium]